jgi:hypothetical protein
VARFLLLFGFIVTTARGRLSVVVLIAAVASAIAAPVFAAPIHPACAANEHDCGKAIRIVSCCCDDRSDASNPSGPVESRVRVVPALTFTPLVAATTDGPRLQRMSLEIQTSPPRTTPLDLPTLFASLLI